MPRYLRRDARAISPAGVEAANHAAIVEKTLRARRDLDRYARIFVVGGGKAGGTMAKAAVRVLGKRIKAGCVAVKDGDPAMCRHIDLYPSGHPVPDERGVEAAKRIAALCEAAEAKDLVLCLLSGGASALLHAPVQPITLAEKQETTKLLLACGATIHEINANHKQQTKNKDGRLA